MAVVYEDDYEGYRHCLKPVEKFECWIIAPDGSEIHEGEIEDSQYGAFRALRDIADDHLREKEIEEEKIEEERLEEERIAREAEEEEAQNETEWSS